MTKDQALLQLEHDATIERYKTIYREEVERLNHPVFPVVAGAIASLVTDHPHCEVDFLGNNGGLILLTAIIRYGRMKVDDNISVREVMANAAAQQMTWTDEQFICNLIQQRLPALIRKFTC